MMKKINFSFWSGFDYGKFEYEGATVCVGYAEYPYIAYGKPGSAVVFESYTSPLLYPGTGDISGMWIKPQITFKQKGERGSIILSAKIGINRIGFQEKDKTGELYPWLNLALIVSFGLE